MLEKSPGLSDELRKHIFQAAHIDWWTADLCKQTVQIGEYVSGLLGIPTQSLPFDVARNYIDPSKLNEVTASLRETVTRNRECVTVPLNTVMFEWQTLVVHVSIRHNDTISGYVRATNEPAEDSACSQRERDLSAALHKEAETNKMKSVFLSNMSHELRTPLNAIVGFSKIIADTESETDRHDYLKIILDNNELLLRLINDILDLSKIESGMLEFNYTDFDAGLLVEEIAKWAQMRLPGSNITIDADYPHEAFSINADRNRVAQVMNNFVNNAIKFTREGTISILARKNETGEFYFSVTDTGSGIPANQLENVFNRFVRLDKGIRGTGLGLAISSSIIHTLGGQIGVESQVGVGSKFWFTLPDKVKKTAAAAVAPCADAAAAPCTGAKQPEEEKVVILIAEDDASNYKLCEVLLGNKYKLLHAWNGVEAVEMFRNYKPSIVLMDINMPEMNGYEASEAIRKFSWDVPIIAVTAYALADDEQHIMESGFDGYLPKPLASDMLDHTINQCIEKEHLHKTQLG